MVMRFDYVNFVSGVPPVPTVLLFAIEENGKFSQMKNTHKFIEDEIEVDRLIAHDSSLLAGCH